MSINTNKIFPLRLPENFHGPLRAKPSLSTASRAKWIERQRYDEPENQANMITRWQKKRVHADIIRERKEMLAHPGKISEQNPQWMKTTFDYFKKSSKLPVKKQTRQERQSYNIFGLTKQLSYSEQPSSKSRFSNEFQTTSKIGSQFRHRAMTLKEITPKIGSIDVRDLSVPRHQIKIGRTEFINTYSVF